MSALEAPKWPRCSRCRKPGHPDRRVEHEGQVYCSNSCVQALQESVSQAKLRALVLERDKGVCSGCGLDCLSARAQLDSLIAVGARDMLYGLMRGSFKGFPARSLDTKGETLWECHHDTPRVMGGAHGLQNAVTVCLRCHKALTKGLAGSRALSRRPFGRGR